MLIISLVLMTSLFLHTVCILLTWFCDIDYIYSHNLLSFFACAESNIIEILL